MLKLEAQDRTLFGKRTASLLAQGLIPAEVYGHAFENKHVQISRTEFEKIFKEAGETSVISLTMEGTSYPVLVHHIAYDQLGNVIRAIDFYAVNLKEKTRAEIPVHIIGESPAVKELGGILIKALEKIEVEALPTDLPSHIEVDITAIKELNQSVHIKDIIVSPKVKIIDDPETVIAVVNERRVEEEPVAAPATEGEVVTEGEQKIEGMTSQESSETEK